MAHACHLNPLKCLNNGNCVENIPLNTTYCECDSCHAGILCEVDTSVQTQLDAEYVFLIVSIIELCLSILNNGLVLELFIRCRRIHNTNCGIYLMVYSILSLVSSILSIVFEVVRYYENQLVAYTNQYIVFRCYVSKIGYNALAVLCILFSSCIAFERGLIICFEGKMNASRWRSYATIIVVFGIAGGSAIPMLVYKCNWAYMPNLEIARNFFGHFYLTAGITIYLLATLLILISFARRIRRYDMENGSYIKTFLKLLYTHLFIFVPPIAYGISEIPYTIMYHTKHQKHTYYQCSISTGEYIIKLLVEVLKSVPVVITWLLFVYPSRVYMTEFYLKTWSGQCVAKILLLCKSYNDREESNHLSTKNERSAGQTFYRNESRLSRSRMSRPKISRIVL